MISELNRLRSTSDEVQDEDIRVETHVYSIVDHTIATRNSYKVEGIVFFDHLSHHSCMVFASVFLEGFLGERDEAVDSPFFSEFLSALVAKESGFKLEHFGGKLYNPVGEVSGSNDSYRAAFFNSVDGVVSYDSGGEETGCLLRFDGRRDGDDVVLRYLKMRCEACFVVTGVNVCMVHTYDLVLLAVSYIFANCSHLTDDSSAKEVIFMFSLKQ